MPCGYNILYDGDHNEGSEMKEAGMHKVFPSGMALSYRAGGQFDVLPAAISEYTEAPALLYARMR